MKNTALLFNEKHSCYDAQAEAMRLAILARPDTLAPSGDGVVYYVAADGDDAANGRTPQTAWRSIARVGAATLAFGDVVLFERGGVYRGRLNLTTGVSYGAYGEGEKPRIYGSPRDYADESLWAATDTPHVWKLDVSDLVGDIGNVIFDEGVACASVGKTLTFDLHKDFDFYHDEANGALYLYLAAGNPGALYDSIELAPYGMILHGPRDVTDVVIENLCIKYGGCHGIQFHTEVFRVAIRGCEIGYIGGSMQPNTDPYVRFGNGIEFIDRCADVMIEDNWVYQCYDAGLTHQSNNPAGFYVEDFIMRRNLVEYCNYNIEYFFKTEICGYRNHLYEGNVLRFAGYGFGTQQRIGSDDSRTAAINGWNRGFPCENFVIRDNVFDTSHRYLIVCPYFDNVRGPHMEHNTYIQHNGAASSVAYLYDRFAGREAETAVLLRADDAETMRESVLQMDKSPRESIFYTI